MARADWKLGGNVNFTSLQAYLDGYRAGHLREILGPENDPGMACEPEKGYDTAGWVFSRGEDTVTVYARYGSWRLGAYSRDIAEAFAKDFGLNSSPFGSREALRPS